MNTNAHRESRQVELSPGRRCYGSRCYGSFQLLVLVFYPYVHEFTCGCPLAPVFKCVSGCALAAVLVLWGGGGVWEVWGQWECSEERVWLVRWPWLLPCYPFQSSEIVAPLTNNWSRSLLRLSSSYWHFFLDTHECSGCFTSRSVRILASDGREGIYMHNLATISTALQTKLNSSITAICLLPPSLPHQSAREVYALCSSHHFITIIIVMLRSL